MWGMVAQASKISGHVQHSYPYLPLKHLSARLEPVLVRTRSDIPIGGFEVENMTAFNLVSVDKGAAHVAGFVENL